MPSQKHPTRPTTPNDVIDGLSSDDPNVSISGTILEWITASGFEGGGGGGGGGGDLVNDSVTNAFLANMPQATIKGRAAGAGTGDPTDLTAIQARTILDVQSGATANSTDAQLRDRTTHTGTQATNTITGLDASLGLLAPILSPTFTGIPAAPTALPGANTTQLATTAFVEARAQAISSGLSFKNSVRVATTASGTFASAFDNGSTIDGVVLATGNRILIKNQSSQAENGIYTVNASGAPTRGTDTDTWTEIVSAFVFVEEGTANADTSWVCNVNTGGTINVTAITFVQFAGTTSAVSDGDKGDVTVSGSGTVWTVDANAITTVKILDANVTTAKVADANITTAKILDANVTAGKLASDAVITAKILDANVTTAKIADSNVTTAKIADANVTAVKIADANVTTAKILDANVTTAKIADANVTTAKVADDAITYVKMQDVSAASRLLGRGSDNGPGDVEEISFGDGLELIGTVLSSTVEGGIPEVPPDSVTNALLADMAEGTIKGRAAAAGTGDPADLTAAQVRTIINVQDGANANSTDAQLRDRTTHTGLQATSTITGLDTALGLLAPIASPTFTGVPSAPTAAPGADTTQLATTAFVEARAQAIASGLSFKNSVRVATTANGTFASAFDNASVVDGVTLITGDRILLKNQSTPAENGIYTVAASGAPTRGTDADTWAELVSAFCFVEEGTINADTSWVCNVNAGGTINVTAVTFVQFAGTTSAVADGDKGDISVSGSGTVWTIDPSAVTTAKILDANVTAGKLASDAVTAVKILDANVTTAKVADDAITYAKIQNIAGASRLLGRGSAGGSGNVEEILLGAGLSLGGTTLSATAGGGVSGTPNPSTIATGTISTALSSTEVQLGSSITITPSSTTARIQIWAWAHATKDTGTTVRVMSIRVRNGTTNGSTQVGSDVTASSAGIASTKFGGSVPGFVHSPASTALQTYTVRAVIGAGASTATNYAIAAVEIGSGGFDIAGLTADATPNGAADYTVVHSPGEGFRKVLLNDLGGVSDAEDLDYTNPSTGGVLRTGEAKLAEFLSVTDFGADPTGIANCNAAFTAAFAAAVGRVLYVPKGTYLLTAAYGVSDFILRGEGPKTTKLMFSGVTTHALTLGGAYAGGAHPYRGIEDLTVESDGTCTSNGMKIRNSFQGQARLQNVHIVNFNSTGAYGLQLTNVQDIVLSGVKTESCDNGVNLQPDEGSSFNTNLLLQDFVIQATTNWGIVDSGGLTANIKFLGGVVQGASGKCVTLTSSGEMAFDGMYFESTTATHQEMTLSDAKASLHNCHFSTVGAVVTVSGATSKIELTSCYFAPKGGAASGGKLTVTGGTAVMVNSSPQTNIGSGCFGHALGFDLAWNTFTGSGTKTNNGLIIGGFESYSGQIDTVANKTYIIELKAVKAFTINSLTRKCASGSCTAAVQIDGVNVTGLSGLAVSTSEVDTNATALNSVAAVQTVALVITANSACLDLAYTLKITES